MKTNLRGPQAELMGPPGPGSLDPMGELDMYYSLSILLKNKNMLISIHLENMSQDLKSQLMNIFLFLWLPQEEDQLGNQKEVNRKHHSEEESLKDIRKHW